VISSVGPESLLEALNFSVSLVAFALALLTRSPYLAARVTQAA
jgi:hypothetical protein